MVFADSSSELASSCFVVLRVLRVKCLQQNGLHGPAGDVADDFSRLRGMSDSRHWRRVGVQAKMIGIMLRCSLDRTRPSWIGPTSSTRSQMWDGANCDPASHCCGRPCGTW